MALSPKKQITEYVIMSVAVNDIPAWWGQVAHIFSWILLQGYVLLPAIFNSHNLLPLKSTDSNQTNLGDIVKADISSVVGKLPIFWPAFLALVIGSVGMVWCLVIWRGNYIWGLREVILPGFYAASTGLLSAIINTWAIQKPPVTPGNRLSLLITGVATAVFAILWVVYKWILLRNAKKRHIDEAGYHIGLGQSGEGNIQTTAPAEGRRTTIANAAFNIEGPLQSIMV